MSSNGDYVRQYLEERCKKGQPGERLPTSRSLAEHLNVSDSTVKRILREFRDLGKLKLIQGKGAFIPRDEKGEEIPDDSDLNVPKDKPDWLYQLLLEQIKSGVLRTGQSLPSLKFIRHEKHVSSRTIARAFSRLIEEKLAYRIGNSIIVGDSNLAFVSQTKREVHMYLDDGISIKDLFSSPRNSTLDFWIGRIMAKLESELISRAYQIRIFQLNQFNQNSLKWKQKQAPNAILFFKMNSDTLKPILSALKRLTSSKLKDSIRYLMDWDKGKIPSDLPLKVNCFSRGTIYSERARVIARELILRGYDAAIYHIHWKGRQHSRDLMNFVRILDECRTLDPNFEFKVRLYTNGKVLSRQQLIKELNSKLHLAFKNERFVKSKNLKTQTIEDFMFPAQENNQNWTAGYKTVDIALEMDMVDLIKNNPIREKLNSKINRGLLLLGNNDEAIWERISSCVPDWDGIGYLLAHSLIGDIPIQKTKNRNIQMKTLFLDRDTL